MKSFKNFLKTESVIKGVPQVLHDFLFHLSSPMGEKQRLDEVTVFDISRGDRPGEPVHKAMNMPRTSAMIEKGRQEMPEGNLYKRMGQGFKSTFDSMKSETPQESRAKLRESRAVFRQFAQDRGYKSAPKLLGGNKKTEKSSGEGVLTKGLSLAPHTTSGLNGFDVCPRSSAECRKNCLGTEAGGNKQYPDFALSSKVLKTHFIAQHPEHAARIMDHEIGSHVKKAEKAGMVPGVRLNITSDIPFEKFSHGLFERHPTAQFYDYTKNSNRVGHPDLPKNYHLTLSHTGTGHDESNDKHVVKALEKGHVAAMVYHRGKNVPEPTHVEDVSSGHRYPVVNGDDDDNTFDRHATVGRTEGKPGHGVVSGLRLKGVSNADAGNFANKVDSDGVIRINKPR